MKQRKINNFFLKHPKVKKVGIILSTIFALWGVFLTIILIISMSSNSVKNSDRKIQNIAYGDYQPLIVERNISPKMILDYAPNQHYLISFTDYANKPFVYHLLADWNLWSYNVGETISIGNLSGQIVLTSNLVMNQWGNSPLNSQFVRVDITRGSDIITGGAGSGGDHGERVIRFRHYTTSFYSAENSVSLSFMFDVAYSEYTYDGVQWYNYSGEFINVYSYPTDKVMLLQKQVGNNYVYLGMLSDSEFGSYQEGYASGRQVGYVEGKQIGYDEGYAVGSTGVSNNPFQLISNAFSSLANILNIQLIPGLTLGVIFFAPITITLIIVIVRMFRG